MTNDSRIWNARMPSVSRRRMLALGLGISGAFLTSTQLAAQYQRPSLSYPVPPPINPVPRRRAAGINPILFWNDTALQLDSLDHSIDAKDARAPGPFCAARALALAHIVMAAAAAAAYACD